MFVKSLGDPRRTEIGTKDVVGKLFTGTLLGLIANLTAIYYGRRVIGTAIDDPLYYSFTSAVILAILLNVKLYLLATLKFMAETYLPEGLIAAWRKAKEESRQNDTLPPAQS